MHVINAVAFVGYVRIGGSSSCSSRSGGMPTPSSRISIVSQGPSRRAEIAIVPRFGRFRWIPCSTAFSTIGCSVSFREATGQKRLLDIADHLDAAIVSGVVNVHIGPDQLKLFGESNNVSAFAQAQPEVGRERLNQVADLSGPRRMAIQFMLSSVLYRKCGSTCAWSAFNWASRSCSLER